MGYENNGMMLLPPSSLVLVAFTFGFRRVETQVTRRTLKIDNTVKK